MLELMGSLIRGDPSLLFRRLWSESAKKEPSARGRGHGSNYPRSPLAWRLAPRGCADAIQNFPGTQHYRGYLIGQRLFWNVLSPSHRFSPQVPELLKSLAAISTPPPVIPPNNPAVENDRGPKPPIHPGRRRISLFLYRTVYTASMGCSRGYI